MSYTVADLERVCNQIVDRRRNETVRILEERRRAERRAAFASARPGE